MDKLVRLLLQSAKSISGPCTGHPFYAVQSLKNAVTEGLLSGKGSNESFANGFSKALLCW